MKLLVSTIILALFAALGFGGYWAYEAYLAVFPPLPPGLYAGVLQAEGRNAAALLIDSSRGSRDLWVSVGDPAMPAQRTKTVDSSGSTGLPLIVTGTSTRLRLVGAERRNGEIEGSFIDPIRNERGRWHVRRVSAPALASQERNDLSSWASLYRELVTKEQPPAAVESGDMAAMQAELDRAVEEFDRASKLTPQGELVHLSRDTVRREGRWIQDLLGAGSPETSPSFEPELERAYRVKELLDQISEERRLLDQGSRAESEDLVSEEGSDAEPKPDAQGETGESEEGFYRDL
jgi:hypothetical protein